MTWAGIRRRRRGTGNRWPSSRSSRGRPGRLPQTTRPNTAPSWPSTGWYRERPARRSSGWSTRSASSSSSTAQVAQNGWNVAPGGVPLSITVAGTPQSASSLLGPRDPPGSTRSRVTFQTGNGSRHDFGERRRTTSAGAHRESLTEKPRGSSPITKKSSRRRAQIAVSSTLARFWSRSDVPSPIGGLRVGPTGWSADRGPAPGPRRTLATPRRPCGPARSTGDRQIQARAAKDRYGGR